MPGRRVEGHDLVAVLVVGVAAAVPIRVDAAHREVAAGPRTAQLDGGPGRRERPGRPHRDGLPDGERRIEHHLGIHGDARSRDLVVERPVFLGAVLRVGDHDPAPAVGEDLRRRSLRTDRHAAAADRVDEPVEPRVARLVAVLDPVGIGVVVGLDPGRRHRSGHGRIGPIAEIAGRRDPGGIKRHGRRRSADLEPGRDEDPGEHEQETGHDDRTRARHREAAAPAADDQADRAIRGVGDGPCPGDQTIEHERSLRGAG